MLSKNTIHQISYNIIGCAKEVHKQLGPGFLKAIYHDCLIEELQSKHVFVESEIQVPIYYKDKKLKWSLRLVEDAIIVELTSVDIIHDTHNSQLLSCIKLAKKPKGLLINYNTTSISKTMIYYVIEYLS